MCFGFFAHALHFILGQTGGGGNGNVLTATGGLVLRSYFQNTIGINIKCHFNLWNATRGRRDAIQNELAQ